MSELTTVIPSKIDASATDGEFISVNSDNKLTVGPKQREVDGNQSIQLVRSLAGQSLALNDYSSEIVDIFSVNTGYDNTVDTVSTDAYYTSQSYIPLEFGTRDYYGFGTATNGSNNFTTNVVLTNAGYFDKIYYYAGTSSAITVSIKVGGVTIASKTGASGSGGKTVNFAFTDYSRILQSGETVSIVFSNDVRYLSGQSYDRTYYTITSQTVWTHTSTQNDTLSFVPIFTGDKTVVIDLPADIGDFTEFCLIPYNQSKGVTFDFDGGTVFEANSIVGETQSSPTKLNINISSVSVLSGYVLYIW